MNTLNWTRPFILFAAALCLAIAQTSSVAKAADVEISSLKELAAYAAQSGNTVRMKPGVYPMSDYLTDDVIADIRAQVPAGPGRPPVWMMRFTGNDNRFDLHGVVLEIETELYRKLPRGYHRSVFISGDNNVVTGLTVRHTGDNQGSNGNTMSVWGKGNTLEDVSLYVHGSSPWGYGDLLGKGGPNLVAGQKQSGMMVAGVDNTLRRCRVISRAFGHCFYIQNAVPNVVTTNIRLEDCYAEGVVRPTSDMLRETTGPLANWNFRTIAENRDGRFFVVPGYMKSLVEDGFRTYGGTGSITLVNCTAVNTRAGFEIAGPNDSADGRTLIDGGNAIGCERAYLIGSNTDVRRSRGDIQYGPLLYLRGGRDSDIDLELTGAGSDYTVHALATIAGENHRVRLFTNERTQQPPSVPILLGFGMPAHAEMASPIRPADARGIRLTNDLPRFVIVRGTQAIDCDVRSDGLILEDDVSRKLPTRAATTAPASQPAPQTQP